MVNSCCVCGKESNPMFNRTFHRFPKKENLRAKWFSAIGKKVTYGNARVCSDHFNKCDFNPYTDVRNRLLPNAIPCNKNSKPLMKDNETHSVDHSPLVSVNEKSTLECANSSNSLNESHLTMDCEVNSIVDSHSILVERENTCTAVTGNISLSNVEDESITNICKSLFISGESVNIENNGPHTDNTQMRRKRIHESTREKIMPKYIRLSLPNQGSGVLRRSDFTSNEAWALFVRHMIHDKQQLKDKKNLRKKCTRLCKRVTDFKTLLQNLGRKRLINS